MLEAVAALALLGLALPAIIAAFTDAVSHASRAEDRLQTLRRAQDLVTLSIAQFHGEQATRSGSDANATWSVAAAFLNPRGGDGRHGSSDPVPVQLTVKVQSLRGAETRLDTVFLFREALQ